MQADVRAHNFVVVFCLQTTSTVVEVLRCPSPFRSPPSRLMHRTLSQMRRRTFAVHRRWDRTLLAKTRLADEAHGLLRSLSLTGTIFSSIRSHFVGIQSSRSQYFTSRLLTTSHVVFISTFTEGLLKKASIFLKPPLIGPTAVTSHAAVTSDARSIQISSQNIRIRCFASSCSAIRPNYQSQPPLMGFRYIRPLATPTELIIYYSH